MCCGKSTHFTVSSTLAIALAQELHSLSCENHARGPIGVEKCGFEAAERLRQ